LTCICLLFKGGDVPTPPNSDDERNAPALTDAAPIRPEDSEQPQGMNDGEPEHDQVPEQPVTGRQKARAAASKLYPPETLAKLCTGLKKANIEIVESIWNHYAVPPGTQPDRLYSDDFKLLEGMIQAGSKFSRSQFQIYTYSTRHYPSEVATDELLQMLTNVSHSYDV
jgi:hypothetical protein